jgi:hypothetical protein
MTAPIFLPDRTKLFFVVASSPRPSHWQDVAHYRPAIKIWIRTHSSASISRWLVFLQFSVNISATNSSRSNAARYQSSRSCENMALLVTPMPSAQSNMSAKNHNQEKQAFTARKDLIGFDEVLHKVIPIPPTARLPC